MSTQRPDRAPTPYEMVFPAGGFEPRLDDIRAEAVARGSDAGDPGPFLMLAEAGRLIRELLPEDADPHSILDAGRLIFHAYHFRAAGQPTYVLDPAALAVLLEATAEPTETEPSAAAPPPAAAGYLQLPRNAVWARVGEDAPWEAADGLFWSVAAVPGDAGPGGVADATGPAALHALLVLGIRADRPGFSVVAVDAEEPPRGGDWSDVQARAEGEDFANVLPGGELAGLHALLNGAEVLKLLSRFFRYASARPGAIEALPPAGAGPGESGRRFRVGAGPDDR